MLLPTERILEICFVEISIFLLYWEKLWLFLKLLSHPPDALKFWKPNNSAERITYDCNTEPVIVKFALSICVVQRINASSRPEYFPLRKRLLCELGSSGLIPRYSNFRFNMSQTVFSWTLKRIARSLFVGVGFFYYYLFFIFNFRNNTYYHYCKSFIKLYEIKRSFLR